MHRAGAAGATLFTISGGIHEKKGCDLLIEAFTQAATMAAGLDLVLAGPDQVGMRAGIQNRAEKFGIARREHCRAWSAGT